MQSSLHTASRHHLSWKLPGTHTLSNELILNSSRLFFKPVTAYSSLRTHLDSESDGGGIEKGPLSTLPVSLPFVIRSSTRVSRYFWDGGCLRMVSVDGGSSSCKFDFDYGFLKLFSRFCSVIRDFLIPQQVADSYMDYVRWKFLHRIFSSALQVLATQTNNKFKVLRAYRRCKCKQKTQALVKQLLQTETCKHKQDMQTQTTNMNPVRQISKLPYSLPISKSIEVRNQSQESLTSSGLEDPL